MSSVTDLPLNGLGAVSEIDPFLDLEKEIDRLRRERNAVILSHFYQDGEIQDVADFVGDSLDLSRKAAATDADVIVFCGVLFMAEVAKILSPDRVVLLPDMEAGCSLETSCQPGDFRRFREAHPNHLALTYINCSAEVKTLSDIIVTSTNAEAIIRQLPKDQPIIFAPDKYLGAHLIRQTGRDNIELWPGTCVVHEQFSHREMVRLKTQYPNAPVTSHPECPPEILALSDHIGSTSGMIDFVVNSDATDIIIATEPKIIHHMQKLAPEKNFIGAPGADGCVGCNNCPYMALNTLEKLYLSLRDMTPQIELPEDVRIAARAPLEKMLEMSPKKKAEKKEAEPRRAVA